MGADEGQDEQRYETDRDAEYREIRLQSQRGGAGARRNGVPIRKNALCPRKTLSENNFKGSIVTVPKGVKEYLRKVREESTMTRSSKLYSPMCSSFSCWNSNCGRRKQVSTCSPVFSS